MDGGVRYLIFDAAPVAQAQTLSTVEETPIGITLTASDEDNDPLTYAIVSQPAHGTLGGTPPDLAYTPAADYFGADSFTFKANDGSLDSAISTIAINVVNVNDGPQAVGQQISTAEDTPVAMTLQAT